MKDRDTIHLTECENNQLVEATRFWFAKNGGVVDRKIKVVKLNQEDETLDFIMPPKWNKHEPCKASKYW